MRRATLAVFLLIVAPFIAHAALDPAQIIQPNIPQNGLPITARVTCYGPGADPYMEGPFATSRPDLNGKSIPHTLDDVRLGNSKYVTLASNPSNYNKWYNMGTVTYTSIIDHRQYTLSNVVGFVHDTGCAFDTRCCGRYNTCDVMTRKFDVAYGDFRNGGNKGLINSGSFCGNRDHAWLQVGGPVGQTTVTAGPYTVGYSTEVGSPTGQSSDYCVTSIEPVIVVPRGAVPEWQCYNRQPQRQSPPRPPAPPQSSPQTQPQQSPQQVVSQQSPSQQLLDALRNNQSTPTASPPPKQNTVTPVATLIAQPAVVTRGNSVMVSWSTLGMKADPMCRVFVSGNFLLAQSNNGSKQVPTGSATARGQRTFTLQCAALSGQTVQRSATVKVN